MRVYYTKTDPLYDKELFDYLYDRLCFERRNKIDRLRQDRDKMLSLAAGTLLKYGLCEYGISDDEVIYDGRKPRVLNRDVYFNVSHSGNRAMCVISDDEVGCDCQIIDRYRREAAEKFFCKNEIALIEKSADKGAEFCRLWTLKECLLKLKGCGISDLKSADVLNADNCCFKQYELYDGYKYSVCSYQNDFPEGMDFIDLELLKP